MRAKALACLLLLAGCEERHGVSQQEIDGAQAGRLLRLEDKVSALEANERLVDAKLAAERIAGLSDHRYIETVDKELGAVSNQVSGNAKIYNDHVRTER